MTALAAGVVAADAAFPLCRDPRYEAPVRRLLAGCVELLLDRLPAGRLAGVVLMGSFARGEGTVLPVTGHLRVLGDLEFLVVLPSQADYRILCRPLVALGREASATLGGAELRADIEFGPVELDYLSKRARPSIFVYDLAHHGKVVLGPADLLGDVPRFETDRIPPEDALRLLLNRTVEQLEAYDRLEDLDGEALLDVAYQRVKLLLDLAGSALAFRGRHSSSYAGRPAAFAGLAAAAPELAGLLPPAFQQDLERAARAKIEPAGSELFATPGASLARQRARLRRQIEEAVPAVTALLEWELRQLVGPGELPDLLRRYLAAPGFARRVWEWAKVALHPLPPPLPISRARAGRLFFRSTPPILLWVAAVLAYRELAQRRGAGAEVARLLPLSSRAMPRTAEDRRRAITALWRWCVRNN